MYTAPCTATNVFDDAQASRSTHKSCT
jgi:hypothetical protein